MTMEMVKYVAVNRIYNLDVNQDMFLNNKRYREKKIVTMRIIVLMIMLSAIPSQLQMNKYPKLSTITTWI
jgi:hypothetical protein